jgi:prolyl-tRNA editing enzyme YbaK/EbsC (Cys-tRNA(Pro) deacylase)
MNVTADPEARVRAVLESLGMPYEIVPCDPALADTAAFCEHYGYALADSANTIVVASKKEPKQYAACVALATTKLDVNHAVKKRMGVKRASFASPDETVALTGMAIGGVTALALPEGLPLWIDAAVMDRERIVLGGGSRSCKVLAPPFLLTRVAGAEVVPDLALPMD